MHQRPGGTCTNCQIQEGYIAQKPSDVINTSRTGWEAPKSPVLVVAPNGDEACDMRRYIGRSGGQSNTKAHVQSFALTWITALLNDTPAAAGQMVLGQMEPQFLRKEIVQAGKLQSQNRPLKSIKTIRRSSRLSSSIVALILVRKSSN